MNALKALISPETDLGDNPLLHEILADIARYSVHGPMPYRILGAKYGKRAGSASQLKALVEELERKGLIEIEMMVTGGIRLILADPYARG